MGKLCNDWKIFDCLWDILDVLLVLLDKLKGLRKLLDSGGAVFLRVLDRLRAVVLGIIDGGGAVFLYSLDCLRAVFLSILDCLRSILLGILDCRRSVLLPRRDGLRPVFLGILDCLGYLAELAVAGREDGKEEKESPHGFGQKLQLEKVVV